ncbi:MAG: division/cell wall cluster transcriptional repressor MraZ [Acidobacteriota bacterium]|jgi:MraZ protein|nr:division/cell wall cluster transcriptional repressor MraZ [Acidobacteriota bacterium]
MFDDGSYTAKIDEKSRLRVPAEFRHNLPEDSGNVFYVTSIDGKCARVYPWSVWTGVSQRLHEGAMTPRKLEFLRRTGLYGQKSEMDPQGRILIKKNLRDKAGISGEVLVVGMGRFLEVWNSETIQSDVDNGSLSLEDMEELGKEGIF